MSKKLGRGAQLPQNSWLENGIREVKVTANSGCPMINLTVGKKGNHFSWIVDSGARESIIDFMSFKERFPDIELHPMQPGVKFSQADGSPLNVLGFFSTQLWFGEEPVTAEIHVCKGVTKTRLLGANILSKFPNWGVDNKNQCFKLGNFQIPLVRSVGEASPVCEVQVSQDMKIPPRCTRFVPASLPHRFDRSEFIFKPSMRMFERHKLLVPICLVANDIFDNSIVIKVSNPQEKEVTIYKGTKIGSVSNNLRDYDLITTSHENDVKINSVETNVTSCNMKRELKENHRELFKLYEDSCELLKEEEKHCLLTLLFKYRHVFSKDDNDIGTTNVVKHKIVPRSDKIVYRRQYKHTEQQHQEIDKEVQKLLDSGVIKESMSPYNSPVLMVPKKEAGKWRFCLDCRYINDLTADQYFPIPRVDEVMDSLSGMEVFSVVDMTAGYHQVELEGKTSEMCAFSTRKGHYQYAKLPMGLRGSGMTFQKMVTLLFSGMLHTEILAYLDDCILFSKTVSKHMSILEEVLKRFGDANLKLKPRKCHLFKKQIVYLGFLINKKGICPDPERTRLIQELKEPQNVVEVQRFLGKANYYRKFIPRLAEIAHPLYELTTCKEKNKFSWQVEHQTAFNQIKSILISGKVMGHPRSDREYILDVDASNYALGAELSQVDDHGNLKPIYYASRHLEKSERNYSATARETLAAVFGCEHFRQYLQGVKFKLRTDHNPLVWLRNMKEPKRPYSGWIMRLEQFEYEMIYRAGKEHANADFNSRVGNPEGIVKVSIGIQVGSQSEMQNRINCIAEEKIKSEDVCSNVDKANTPLDSLNSIISSEFNSTPCNKISNNETSINPHSCISSECNSTPSRKESDEKISVKHARNVRKDQIIPNEDIPSGEVLRRQQLEDADIGPVMVKLTNMDENAVLTKAGEQLWRIRGSLEIKEGLLIRWFKLKAGLQAIEQIVLPTSLRTLALESLHDSDFSGHFGEHRTMARVRLRYYWPGYMEDVKNWCRTCHVCQRRKGPKSKNVAPLTSIDTGKGPFENIALDILKLPLTERGNQYLLVIEDFFSKWVEAFPLERTNAPSVAHCVLNGWIARFGCPYTILSDQGREFESKLFKSLNHMLQSKKLRTTTYHPKTDGMVERSNRTIIDVLSKYGEKEGDWDLRIPLVLFALRTSEHVSTGFSPFQLVYGREARIPWDIVYGSPPSILMPLEKWVAERKKQMSQIFKMVQDITKMKQLQQKRYFDGNVRGECQKFENGELVMMYDSAARSTFGKLNSPWTGPFSVTDKLSNCLYKIRVTPEKEVVVNVEKLKKYHERGQGKPGDTAKKRECTEQTEDDNTEFDDSEGEDDAIPDHYNAGPPAPQQDHGGNARQQAEQPQEHNLRQTPPREPIMGHRGERWCNLDLRNVLEGGRRN